jgi:hypothetical protein
MYYSLAELKDIPVFFIVGKGRSGTTLLSTIIDSHPNVASATESRFLLLIWQKYKRMRVWDADNTTQFIKDVNRDILVGYLWEFSEGFAENIASLPKEATIQDLIKLVYIYRKSNFEHKGRIKFIVDKNPKYTIFVDKLISIFPEAKFFRLIRDPRDNVTSQINYSKNPVGLIANKWLNYNEKLDRFAKKHPNQFKTQRFEDLILNKEEFFEKFGEYSNIKNLASYEKERLKIKDKFEEKFSDRLKTQHQATVKPLNPKKIGHHKQKLSEEQIRIIDSYCFPYAENWGYVREQPAQSLTLVTKVRAQINYTLLDFAHKFYYSLPFSVMLGSRNFILNNFQPNKKEKLLEVISSNEKK